MTDTPGPGWRPISEAPRDGRDVLIAGGTWNYDYKGAECRMPLHACVIASWVTDDPDGDGPRWRSQDGESRHEPQWWHPLPELPEPER